jgi:hypothetical protein
LKRTEKKLPRKPAADDSSAAVDLFMAKLEHPCKGEIQALREIICGVHRTIAEGVKWNAPSFRTTEYFATTHLRAKTGVGVILHLGARKRESPPLPVDDPDGLLQWLGKDRAMVSFAGMKELRTNKAAFERIVRQWIKHV